MKMNTHKWTRRLVCSAAALMVCSLSLLSVSCSESDDNTESSEFNNWKERNETYWNSLYQTAKTNADGRWKILPTWTKDATASLKNTEYVIAHVEEEGSGTQCPLYTDTVRIHYAGRLIPTASYASGYLFDQSFTGTFNPKTAVPYQDRLSTFVDGFSTALLYMHEGDRWTVYIPSNLGYGSSERSSVPAYSNLVFDLTLVSFHHPGQQVPVWKAKRFTGLRE